MPSIVLISCLLVVFFLLELLYFKIANHYDIVDKPNGRSSHSAITIRGGGILFSVAVLFFLVFNGFQYPIFFLGLFFIAIISFLDDILTLNNKLRLVVHLIAVLLLIAEWGFDAIPVYIIPIVIILVTGTINAYNFMDGINGITGCYSLVGIVTLFFINQQFFNFVSSDLLIYVGMALLVFNFFNFRTKAKCFAGDVGSVSIAFIFIFLVGKLIVQTQDITYILLLLVYGLDAVVTIGFRLFRKENIFEAHRSHFYQYLANEKKIPHLYIAGGYALIQLIVNTLLINLAAISLIDASMILFVSICLFIWIRFLLEGRERLLNKTTD